MLALLHILYWSYYQFFFVCFCFIFFFPNPLHEVFKCVSVSFFWCFKLYPQVPSRREGYFIKCNDCNGCVGFFVFLNRDISVGMKMLIFGLYHNFPILCKLFMMVFYFSHFFPCKCVCERVRSMKFHFVLPKIVNNYLFVYMDGTLSFNVLIHLVRSSFIYIYILRN